MSKRIGVLVMRLQTPKPTEGHMQLFHEVKRRNDEVIIVLGESPVRLDRKNPMPAKVRQMLLGHILPGVETLVLHNHRSDAQWSQNLDGLLKAYDQNASFTLYGSRDSFIPYYSGEMQTEVISFDTHKELSATAVRESIYKGTYPITAPEQYAAGFIAGANSGFPTSYMAVDTAFIRVDLDKPWDERFELAVGWREDLALYRFPGGFTDPDMDNESEDGLFLESVACRELKEETGLVANPIDMVHIGSWRIKDWRFTGSTHKIASALYLTTMSKEKVVDLSPDDDLDGVKFVNFVSLTEDDMVEEHRPLFRKLKQVQDRFSSIQMFQQLVNISTK